MNNLLAERFLMLRMRWLFLSRHNVPVHARADDRRVMREFIQALRILRAPPKGKTECP